MFLTTAIYRMVRLRPKVILMTYTLKMRLICLEAGVSLSRTRVIASLESWLHFHSVVSVGPASSHRGPVTCAPPDTGLDVGAQKTVEWVCLTGDGCRPRRHWAVCLQIKGIIWGEILPAGCARGAADPQKFLPIPPPPPECRVPQEDGSAPLSSWPPCILGEEWRGERLCSGWAFSAFWGLASPRAWMLLLQAEGPCSKSGRDSPRGFHTTVPNEKGPQWLWSEPPIPGYVSPDVCPPWRI